MNRPVLIARQFTPWKPGLGFVASAIRVALCLCVLHASAGQKAGVSQRAEQKPELVLFHATDFHETGPLPSYEVATVKLLDPNTADGMVKLPPGGGLSPLSIRRYIMNAYGAVYAAQIVGGPEWLNKDAYVIHGKIPDDLEAAMQKMTGEERIAQNRMMQECLLADRFHLKAHFETRVLPVYELVPAKGGLKIAEVPAPPERKPGDPAPRADDPLAPGSVRTTVNGDGLRVLNGRAINMQLLMRVIAGDVGDRPLVDHTGFAGAFDVSDFTWAPLSVGGESDAVSVTSALREKLGVRLVPGRDPVEVLVIDGIERPGEN